MSPHCGGIFYSTENAVRTGNVSCFLSEIIRFFYFAALFHEQKRGLPAVLLSERKAVQRKDYKKF